MFNPFNRGVQKNDPKHLKAKQGEMANMLNNKLVAFTEIKQLENNLYNHCFKKCLKLDDNIFSDEERECLSNCNGKILRLFEISHHDFSSIEQNIHILSKGLQGKDL